MKPAAVRPRVLLLTTSFPLVQGSASGVFVARLAAALARRCDLRVLVPAASAPASTSVVAGCRVQPVAYAPARWRVLAHGPGGVPVALRSRPWLWPLVPALLVTLLAAVLRSARGIDVVHANWAICGALAGVAALVTGKPVVTTLRGEDVSRARGSRVSRAVLALAVRCSTRIVAVSDAIREELIADFPAARERITHIANGVDDELLGLPPPATGARPALAVLYVGSLIPRKAVERIVGALTGEWPGPAPRLRIVGAGPEQAALAALAARLGVDGRVTFVGPLAPAAVAAEYAAADVLVLASRSEGRPNVVVEAMAAGRAVVAAAIDGVRELIDDGRTGLLFDDDAELRVHLSRLAGDPGLCRALGAAARSEVVVRGLTWDRAADAYVDRYLEAIDG